MQKKITKYNNLVKLFTIFLLLSFLFGCSTGLVVTSKPNIHYFTSSPSTIDSGESSTLSWDVTGATIVTIDQGIGPVELSSGTHSVSPTTTTTYTMTATNSDGSVYATTTVKVTSAVPDIKTKTIQPGSEGKDAYVSEAYDDINFGESLMLWVGKYIDSSGPPGALYRAYMQFDLSSIPADAVITEAKLKLYQYHYTVSETITIGAYRVLGDWTESTIIWNNQPGVAPEVEASCLFDSALDIWREWQITDLVQGWLDRSIDNYGIMLKSSNETIFYLACFWSSDETLAIAKRPKLEIKYYIP